MAAIRGGAAARQFAVIVSLSALWKALHNGLYVHFPLRTPPGAGDRRGLVANSSHQAGAVMNAAKSRLVGCAPDRSKVRVVQRILNRQVQIHARGPALHGAPFGSMRSSGLNT